MGKKNTSPLANIPSVDSLLEIDAMKDLLNRYNRSFIIDSIRICLDTLRIDILKSTDKESIDLTPEAVIKKVAGLIERERTSRFQRIINATGVILHTNIGRALLAEEALDAMRMANEAPRNLELDLATGKRGHRDAHVEDLVCRLTGAEAATVVNNNAAAVMLSLNTLAQDKDVIISRGQLVEIGGSFRLPDVVVKSGARLVEVGTTNRTYIKDYAGAVGERTGALLCCHPSNFIVMGFTTDVGIEELVDSGGGFRGFAGRAFLLLVAMFIYGANSA